MSNSKFLEGHAKISLIARWGPSLTLGRAKVQGLLLRFPFISLRAQQAASRGTSVGYEYLAELSRRKT